MIVYNQKRQFGTSTVHGNPAVELLNLDITAVVSE